MTHTFHVTVTTDDLNLDRPNAHQIASEIRSHLDYERHLVGITEVAVEVNGPFDEAEWLANGGFDVTKWGPTCGN